MTQHIEYFYSTSLHQLDVLSNDWIQMMEKKTVGFIVINVSLVIHTNHTIIDMQEYILAVLYGVRDTSYTTDELVANAPTEA